jgi:nicotinate-nucleotide adenylyltransferase
MRKIGILGGTFDPPHYGHLLIANEVGFRLELDEVWFMPNQLPPHKVKLSDTTNENRVEMLNRAIKDHRRFKIESIELNRKGPSYTIDTMRILKTKYPTDEFYFIIGADMIEYLPKWNQIDELIQLVQFVGVKRPGYKEETSLPVILVEVPQMDISSKMIRNRIMNNEPICYLLPDEIRDYIKEHQLYGSTTST